MFISVARRYYLSKLEISDYYFIKVLGSSINGNKINRSNNEALGIFLPESKFLEVKAEAPYISIRGPSMIPPKDIIDIYLYDKSSEHQHHCFIVFQDFSKYFKPEHEMNLRKYTNEIMETLVKRY